MLFEEWKYKIDSVVTKKGSYMERLNDFQAILIDMSVLRYVVKSNVNVCHYDINHECENFYRDLLNILWDCDFENLNTEEKNAKGIDLIDKRKKIAIQVTSDKRLCKIKRTIEKFEANYNRSEYKLYILNILAKSEHADDAAKYADGTNFEMNCSIDVDDILLQIEDSSADKISEIRRTIESNLGYYKRFLNRESSLHSFFESSAKPGTTLDGLKEIAEFEDLEKRVNEFYEELKSVPREMRKAVWIFITKCDYNSFFEQLYFIPESFSGFVEDAGLNNDKVGRFIRSEKILSHDGEHIRIDYQDVCCALRKIKGDILEQIILGPDFSLLDNPLELSE